MKTTGNKYITAAALAVCLFLSAGCRQQAVKQTALEAIPVKAALVRLQDFDERIDYVGSVKADNEALVYPKVSGKILEKVKKEGDKVSKGETLAYIDRDETGLTFENAPVESPLGGVVGKVYVDIGSSVSVQTPVALVVNMDKVKISLDIPERYLPRISLGQEAEISVDAYPQEKFDGSLTKIEPVLEPATRTARVEITVNNPRMVLRSGMFARVRLIILRHKNVPVIRKEAVIGKEPNASVFVVEGGKAALRKVVLGILQNSYYEIKDGVKDGDWVVIMGQQRLYDGAAVIVEQEDS